MAMEVGNESTGIDKEFIVMTKLLNDYDSDCRVFGKLKGILGWL